MQGVIDKVCSQLITNPHVVGIILDCENFPKEELHLPLEDIVLEEDNRRIDLCIISRETGNQKILYSEDDYLVCLWWKSENEFHELIRTCRSSEKKRILYDKTGMLNQAFSEIQVTYS